MSQKLAKYYTSFQYIENQEIPYGAEAFFDHGKIFIIESWELNDKERMLLKSLYPFQEATKWMQYLLYEKEIEEKDQTVHILQIHLNQGDSDLWLHMFLSFFDKYEEVFSLSEQDHVLILNQDEIGEIELGGIIQTLHEDLGINASIYIGEAISVNKNIVACFKEDQELFEKVKHQFGVYDFKSLYIKHYIGSHLKTSAHLSNINKEITKIKDGAQLVEVLWECQGNITLAAQLLYLHRNTLNYRLDKFEESTGLSLRSLQDLQLAYFSQL